MSNIYLNMYSFGGILTVNAVIKIQRCWRGRKGREDAAKRYLFSLTEKTEIIRGLCRCWKVSYIAVLVNDCIHEDLFASNHL
jgi:hypothetical protein